MLKICPRLVDRSKRDSFNVKGMNKVLAHSCESMFSARFDSDILWADACYWTFIEIGVPSATWDKLFRDPKYAKTMKSRGLIPHPDEAQEEDEDEDWMEEYMYKRS